MSYDDWIVITFFALGAVFGLAERWHPVRATHWRRTFWLDMLGLVVVWTCTAIATVLMLGLLAPLSGKPPATELFSAPVRFAIYLLLGDLARYTTHRLMHTSLLWRTHRFHHSPKQLYWFSGNRASPVHVVLFVAPQVFLGWLLAVPPVLIFALGVFGQLMNNLMHANWNLDAGWQRRLEWLITTPRYHAVHHAVDPALAGKNLASFFTIWDRLFGSYVNPDRVDLSTVEYGTDDQQVPRYRMVLGI